MDTLTEKALGIIFSNPQAAVTNSDLRVALGCSRNDVEQVTLWLHNRGWIYWALG